MKRAASLVSLAVLAFATPGSAQEAVQPEDTYAVGAVKSATASSYMVVAAHPAAAEAGRAVLAEGGTAADAAVAVQLMLTLVEPQSSGLGGGAFAVYWDASGERLTTYDGREKAPLAADGTYWLGDDGEPIGWRDAVPGGKSVGVPGTPALLQHLLDRHGQMPRARLAAPAISAARNGFEVSPRLSASIATGAERGLKAFPAAARYFFDETGEPLAAGTILKNEPLAESLEAFAKEGAAPFYAGAIAKDILWETLGAPLNPGMLTPADFAAYEVVERPAVCAPYRGYDVCGMGPPSSGALTVGQILMLLDHHDMTERSATSWLKYVEASRLAYADRALYMADSDFVDMPEGLLDPRYMKARAALIGEKANAVTAGTPPWREGALRAPDTDGDRPGTSHFVIRDKYGDIISMTTTIETGFGSRLMAGGFLLNNELTDFSRAPEKNGVMVANRVEGGKRPRSSMAPTIVLKDGKPVIAIGSPGGSRIIGYVATSLIGMIDWHMTPAEAASMGHVTASGGRVDLEAGTETAELAAAVEAFGLEARVRDLNSGLSALLLENGILIGAADPRREGVALGE
ncbi:MAG: gamma-glutamyltransferase family protein [Pikeienuella sp.]